MTETYNWGNLRQQAIHAYADTPGAELENRILTIFRQHPQLVAALIPAVAARVHAGKVRSGWAVLATECERAATANQEQATGTGDRSRALQRANQWMHAAGMHYDRWTEAHDELFGHQGRLRHWPHLANDMRTLWLELRPAGAQTETEADERAEKWKRDQTRIHEIAAARRHALDQKQAAHQHQTQLALALQTPDPLPSPTTT